jgi:hypothetical protein
METLKPGKEPASMLSDNVHRAKAKPCALPPTSPEPMSVKLSRPSEKRRSNAAKRRRLWMPPGA